MGPIGAAMALMVPMVPGMSIVMMVSIVSTLDAHGGYVTCMMGFCSPSMRVSAEAEGARAACRMPVTT